MQTGNDFRTLWPSPCVRAGVIAITLGLAACAPSTTVRPDAANTVESTDHGTAQSVQEEQIARLRHARQLIESGRVMGAIAGPLEDIINQFENHVVKSGTRYYCARTTVETLMYLAGEAAAGADASGDSVPPGSDKPTAVVLDPVWAYAYQMKGYALLELGRVAEAQVTLQKAVDLSPSNSQFLSELAYSYQMQGDSTKALTLYNSAEVAANVFTPEDRKIDELTRALRGQGYVLVEMGKLSEAEDRYEASLDLNPSDELSKNELRYIKDLRDGIIP